MLDSLWTKSPLLSLDLRGEGQRAGVTVIVEKSQSRAELLGNGAGVGRSLLYKDLWIADLIGYLKPFLSNTPCSPLPTTDMETKKGKPVGVFAWSPKPASNYSTGLCFEYLTQMTPWSLNSSEMTTAASRR